MILGIDIDDTITNTSKVVNKYLRQEYPKYDNRKLLSKKEYRRFLKKHIKQMRDEYELKDGVKTAWEYFKENHFKIIIITSMPECSYLDRAKKLGAEGFWYKDNRKESLISVMDKVMEGQIVYPDNLQLVNIGVAKSNEFTNKELIVLRLMTGGYSNQEIADKLGVSLNAVKKHISNMLSKTCLRSRTELAVKARESGLVILERAEMDI